MTKRFEFRGLSDGRTYTTTVIEAADFDAACAKAKDMLKRAVCHIDACVVTDRDDLTHATSARFERDDLRGEEAMTKTETLLESAFEDGRAWAQTDYRGEVAAIVFAESMAYARTLTDASDPQIFEIRRRFFEGADCELFDGDWTDCQ